MNTRVGLRASLLMIPFFSLGAVIHGCAGKDGSTCSVSGDGQGTTTIVCTDGTTATVKDGLDGQDGQNGANGINGRDGTNGRDGAAGAAGANGRGCTVTPTTSGVRVDCGTSTATIQNGTDGESCSAIKDSTTGAVAIVCEDGTRAEVGTAPGYTPRRENDVCLATDQCPGTDACAKDAPTDVVSYCRRKCTLGSTGQCPTGQSCFTNSAVVATGGVCSPALSKGAICRIGDRCEQGSSCVSDNASTPNFRCRTSCSSTTRTVCSSGESCDTSKLACFPSVPARYEFRMVSASVPTSSCLDGCNVRPDLEARISVGGSYQGSTRVETGFSVIWNDAISVAVPSGATEVTISVYDRDPEQNCIFCGWVYQQVAEKRFSGTELNALLRDGFSGQFPQAGVNLTTTVARTGFYP